MTGDELAIIGIAAAWSGAVGLVGFWLSRWVRRTSLRWQAVVVAAVAIGAVLAGVVGTSRAMFLSAHDFAVLLWVCLVAGLVALAFAWAVAGSVVRASRELREEARRFGDEGSFDPGDRAGRAPAELSALSDELERTSARLQQSRSRERRLEESRRELVSWVSHDLRTPLAGLRAMTEALEDGMAAEPDRYLHQMRVEVDRMVRMADDLFELSRIHAGMLDLTLETVALVDLVSESVASADPVARRREIRLTGDVDEGLVLRVDPDEIARALSNLVMNAIRHTPAGGEVAIRGESVDGAVALSVSDECGGIPAGDLDRVFDVAWRGTHARTPRDDGGAGLGLAIVEGIVAAHRGSVAVENLAAGCRFLVRLPA